MRTACLCALLAAAACAHRAGLQTEEGARRLAEASAGSSVEIRAGPGDEEDARRVREALPAAVAAAERWGRLPARVHVALHPTRASFEGATGLAGQEWVLAWASGGGVDLRSPARWPGGAATARELALILAHELTHCVLYREAGGGGDWADRGIPPWFREGMASVAAGERHGAGAPGGDGLHPERPERIYAAAHRAFALLVERHGEAGVRRLIARVGEGRRFPDAFAEVFGLPLDAFERGLGPPA